MNINELDAYNLADAVKFNEELNPAIWSGNQMKPEVRAKLLAIADDFREFLGLSDLEVKDITVSGSNAAYTYTPHSDIDLHLVVDIPQADSDEVYRELFDAKKYQYNDLHNITIGGYDVELYVEDARKQPVSQGIYSVKNDDWIKIPLKRRATINDEAVKSKFEDIGHRIESALKEQDSEKIDALARKIKNFRQAGLDANGEFGPENLAYKMLRKQGLIKQLYDARAAAQDAELSLTERKKKKKKVKYGFGGYWYPGYSFDTGSDAGGGDGGGESRYSEDLDTDGVMMTRPTNCSSEAAVPDAKPSDEAILKDFIDFVGKELKLKELPVVKLRKDPQWSVVNKTFGRYTDDRNMLEVAWGQRHIMDVLRTVAHELTHRRQHEREAVPSSAGETGSPYENEANARAGILMRDYARLHPEYFEAGQAEQLHSVEEGVKEKLGAMAAAACIAGTPGCATTDIQSGLRAAQTIGNLSQIKKGNVERALGQDLKNYLRAKAGQSGEGNLSTVHQIEKQVTKEASGYIPTKKQANDPRFKMALTVDVKPGQTGKEANKLDLETDTQGHPNLLIKGLKNALREFKETGALPKAKPGHGYGYTPRTQVPGDVEDDLGNQEATGPEFPPQLPAGTTKIDVKDLTDWYRLGMDISDMDDADPEDYNQGPPETVIVFPSDEAEQDYLKQFKRLGLKTHDIDPDVPGGEDVTGKHLKEEQLDEVKMSPGALRKFAASPEAQGIIAGFEAELIFRDTRSDDDDGEMEADMDYDERTSSIDDVIDFFSNDDHGYGMSDRQADRLRNRLDEAYFEWRDDQIIRDFEREADDLIRDQWLDERPMVERIHSALVDGMGLTDEQADEVIKLHGQRRNKEISGSDMSEEQLDMASQYSEAKEIADSILDEEVEASLDNQDGYYDAALDGFRDSYDADDSGFFSDMGWRWMSDIMNEFSLDWPYYTGGGGNSGSREWDEIAREIEQVTGKPVEVGYGYHSAKRKPNTYVLEPDSSLSPDDSDDMGLELVSPPLPLDETIKQLTAIVDWANSDGNAYTNSSTGLHMGVSIPYKGGDVDYLKLITFLGDQYVLEKFGRAANTYCDSALKKLKQNVAGSKNRGDDKIMSAMELMKNNLIELAQRYVQQGVGNSKYTSAHIKPGYIEFRSPGGDYLSAGDREIGVLEDTMRRFAYAMYLAGRPDLERKEYYKKLYKLIAPEGNKDLEMFAKFSSGEISADELKKQWAEKVIAKEVPVTTVKSNWKLYNRFTNKPVVGAEYSNYTELDALERAKAKVSPASSMEDFKKTYELRDIGTNTGRWRVMRRDNNETLEIIDAATRGEATDQARDKYTDVIPFYVEPYGGEQEPEPEPKLSRRAKLAKQIAQPTDYVIINKHSMLPFYTFRASSNSQAVDFGVTYLRDKGLDVSNFSVQKASNVKQAIDNRVDSKQLQQRVQDSNTGRYEIVDRRTGEVVLRYRAADAEDAGTGFNNWLTNQGLPIDTENYGYRAEPTEGNAFERNSDRIDAIRARQPEQVRMPSGVPVWELFDVDTGTVLNVFADHNADEAKRQAMSWLRSVGAEDPSTYTERFTVRPKQLQPGERNNPPQSAVSEGIKTAKSGAKQWTARIHVKNPQYSGWVDANTWAPNIAVARQMFKQQYNLQDWHITAVKEVR